MSHTCSEKLTVAAKGNPDYETKWYFVCAIYSRCKLLWLCAVA